MRGICTLLHPDSILLQQEVHSRKQVFGLLSDALETYLPRVEGHVILERLTARERLGSTGLGAGVAIPHCRIGKLHPGAAAIVILKTPIPFDAEDGNPVDVFIALVVSEDTDQAHLQYMAELAAMLESAEQVTQLRKATDAAQLFVDLCRTPEYRSS